MGQGQALIVIDMQRGFLEAGNPLFCGAPAQRIIGPVSRLIAEELQKETALFFSADTHEPDDEEFKIFPPHCIRGDKQTEIIPELAGYLPQATLIEKHRYSAFFDTDLEKRLQENNSDRLIVCGVCTDICVLHTVADARNRDYQVTVLENCVSSFDTEAHEFALQHMERILGARILKGNP